MNEGGREECESGMEGGFWEQGDEDKKEGAGGWLIIE